MNIILIALSLIPVYFILSIIYSNDKVEKEPAKLLILTFIGGVISLFLTKFLASKYQYYLPFLIEENPGLEAYKIFLISFGEIGLIEELCKWLILYFMIWRNKEFNHIYDAIVYAVFISLGFATIENFFYLWNTNFATLIVRSLFTVPGHAFFGVIMGYFFGYAKYYQKMGYKYNYFKYMYTSLFSVIVLHGLFDYFLAFENKYSTIIFIGYALLLGIISFFQIRKVNKLELTWDR